MAVLLLRYRKSTGGYESCCNSHCYDALASKINPAGEAVPCACVCGGTNHGMGLEWAIKNTRQRFEWWQKQQNEKGFTLALGRGAMQPPLPGILLPRWATRPPKAKKEGETDT